MTRIAAAFRDVSARLKIQDGGPIRQMATEIVPVVQVASPMFMDRERDLFMGGGESGTAFNRYGSVALICNVQTLVFASLPTTANYWIYTLNAASHDPFNDGFVDSVPSVQPFGRVGSNLVRTGRGSGTWSGDGAFVSGSAPAVLIGGGERPLYIQAGELLVMQQRSLDTVAAVTYAWSELP